MSDYSSTYPTQSPVFAFDAKAGKLDSRLSYSRSSGGTYMSSERHLSSLNLTTNSNDLSDWSRVFITRTLSQVGPDGSSNAAKLTGQAGTVFKAVYNATLANTSAQTISFFAKEDTHRYIQVSVNGDATKYVNFDLNGVGAVSANGSGVTASITASGNGYLRCAVNLTLPSTSVYISLQDSLSATREATTASTGSIYIFGAMSTTLGDATNVVAYQSSGSQIHREFAPTLKTAAANAPRFEFDASGNAEGLLIEAQATSLITYSEDFSNSFWDKTRLSIDSNVAVAPDGTLTASAMRVDGTAASTHRMRFSYATGGATPQTFSIFAKAGSKSWVALRFDSSGGAFTGSIAYFNLASGTTGTVDSGVTATISACGNGYYRCSITRTALASATGQIELYVAEADNDVTIDGNSYDYILAWGAMVEANTSAPSSYIKSNSGSSTTRSADSCSVATSSFYTGGDVSIVSETIGGSGNFAGCWVIKNSTGSEALQLYKQSAAATEATDFHVYANSGGTNTVDTLITSSASAGKIAVSYGSNDVAFTASGNAVQTDTSASTIGAVDTLIIGGITTTNQLNGHIKRVALYNVALSDTELQAITS